jgi:2,6-dihydroxypyridine 3-monooxygenase
LDSGTRALVVGGSIGGLTAALALRETGWEVDVYERSTSALESRGVGIVLHPMTVRYFVESGSFSVEDLSVRADVLRYLASDGSTIHESPCGYMFTNWNSIYRALLMSWDAAHYHLGETLVALTADTRFASGREEISDLLVCADGIASTARSLLLPDVRRRYAGYVWWRGGRT